MEANHSKLKENFARLRNQPWAAKMVSFCCEISQPSCTDSYGVLLKLLDICDRHFEIFSFTYFSFCVRKDTFEPTFLPGDSLASALQLGFFMFQSIFIFLVEARSVCCNLHKWSSSSIHHPSMSYSTRGAHYTLI